MLTKTIESLDISVHINLKLMKNQLIFLFYPRHTRNVSKLMNEFHLVIVIVHCDTTTFIILALRAYYYKRI